MSAQRLALAVAFALGGFFVTYLLAQAYGGAFIEGNPGVIVLIPVIWGPALIGLIACVVTLWGGRRGAGPGSKGRRAPPTGGQNTP